jgi:hypothetical protein
MSRGNTLLLDERTVSGIRAGTFGSYTKLIQALAAKVNELRVKLDETCLEKRAIEEQVLSQRKPQVLIVIHPDGFIEVYGDSVSVRIENVLNAGESHQREAIELLEDARPWLWKRPLKFIAYASVKDCRTPQSEIKRLQEMELCGILNAIQGK